MLTGTATIQDGSRHTDAMATGHQTRENSSGISERWHRMSVDASGFAWAPTASPDSDGAMQGERGSSEPRTTNTPRSDARNQTNTMGDVAA